MPNNWNTYKLGEIADIKGGKRLPKGDILVLEKTNHPYIRVTDMGTRTIPIEKVQYVPNDVFPKISRYIVNTNDLILSIVGTVGSISIIDEKLDNASLTENCVKITNLKDVDNVFLYHYLMSDVGQFEISKGIVGSTQPKLPIYNINNLEIKLPQLQEQQSIAAILSAIDDKIENNLAINKTLEEMAMALYKHWFVDFGPFQDGEFVESELGMIPKGWEVKSVYDIATYVNGAAFKPSELIEEGKYVIKISELNGGISKNTGKSVKEVKPEQIIKDGSVLFSWSATLDIFLWDRGEALLNQHIFNVLPNNTLSKEVLYFLLKNIIAYFKAIAADRATTMGHIKITHLKETLISIPNKEIQIEIDRLFKPLFDQILENLTENQTLTQLRDSLLPQLISGAVRLKEFRE